MPPFKSRLLTLMKVISLKQNVFKAKSKTLSTIISGSRQMKSLKNVNFQFQTIFELFKHLITINVPQLTTMVVLSFFSLLIRLFCANINTFLIDFFQQSRTASNLIQTILILIVYKLIKNVVDQWSSYLQMNYGFQGYSALYYHFLSNKKQITGQVLNIIEDDMQKVANMPYSLVNFPFLSILIFVLTALLLSASSENSVAIVLISLFLYVINCVGGLLIFKMNEKIMKQKDYRLSLNLQQSYQSQSENLKARSKQVSMIKFFLMVKVFVKWSLEFIFIFMYAFVFLWTNPQEKNEDQLYYKLTLLGMLKISFNSLFMESYYLALVFNSLKRIILCQNRQSIQSSTIGCYEDFMKKNQKPSKKIDQIKNLRESTESSLTSQRSSISYSVLQKDNDKNQKSSIQIKQIKKNAGQVQKKKKRYKQKGQIKLFELAKSIFSNSNIFIVIGVILLAIGIFYLKFQTLFIFKSIIHNSLSPYQTFIFILPGVLYTLFYLLVIFMFVNVSHKLFKNLSSNNIEGQDLNRVSGDIQMVDKYVSPAFYQFSISTFGLLASLVFSVAMIHDGYFIVSLAMILTVIVFLSVYSNRYFMKSRREIKRIQCKTKSKIIQTYTSHSETGPKFQKIEKFWKLINIYKNLGIMIENSSIFLLNIMVLLIQVIFLIICFAAEVQRSTMKLILVFILQIDFSLTTLFLNAIYLEMGLVNFERCLNFVKQKQKSRKTQIPKDTTD